MGWGYSATHTAIAGERRGQRGAEVGDADGQTGRIPLPAGVGTVVGLVGLVGLVGPGLGHAGEPKGLGQGVGGRGGDENHGDGAELHVGDGENGCSSW